MEFPRAVPRDHYERTMDNGPILSTDESKGGITSGRSTDQPKEGKGGSQVDL